MVPLSFFTVHPTTSISFLHLLIQCAFRCHRARLRIIKQRGLMAEKERERRELEELERLIEGLHTAFMKELLVIRAQTGMRAKLARKYVAYCIYVFNAP
ncbi:hypothetical protein EON64_08900 [archaeon]|nr:MAG: hypothetical protein EON64_08900 [archaeon]